METGPQLKVSSDRLVKLRIVPVTPGLQGKQFIHYTTAAPHVDYEHSNILALIEHILKFLYTNS